MWRITGFDELPAGTAITASCTLLNSALPSAATVRLVWASSGSPAAKAAQKRGHIAILTCRRHKNFILIFTRWQITLSRDLAERQLEFAVSSPRRAAFWPLQGRSVLRRNG